MVDVTREVLVQYSDIIRSRLSAAVWTRDLPGVAAAKAAMLSLIDDLEQVLATDDGFLLGSWLDSAHRKGATPRDAALYGWNARSQLTLYLRDVGTPDYSSTMDYGAKHWSGLVGGYYRRRWELYLGMVDAALEQHTPLNCTDFVARSVALTYEWMRGTEAHPSAPKGNALALAQAMHRKYAPLVRAHYYGHYRPRAGTRAEL